MNLSTPYVVIDLDKAEKNIRKMIEGLNKAGVAHRPHIKPHKSIELAKLQIHLGAQGITCAKLAEAEVMADGGIDDILIAFPIIGEENLNRLASLCQKANVKTIVDSYVVAEGLSKVGERLNRSIEILIELDGGIHRGGVQPGQPALEFAKSISLLPGIDIVGIFTYMGQIYGQSSLEEIKKTAKLEADVLIQTKKMLEENGFKISITSGGSTPSSIFADQLEGITESRAGNYIFYDMNAVYLGVATEEDCSLKIRSRVVSTPLPGYATIDAGSKALTSDGSLKMNTFGYIYGKPNVTIVKLNEEHGFLRFDPTKYTFEIGEEIEIIPNHSCVIPNLNEQVYGLRQGKIEKEITVNARGKSY